jgi:hypothetical protein
MIKHPNYAILLKHPERGEMKILRSFDVGDYSSYQLEEKIGSQTCPTWYPKEKLELIFKLCLEESLA